MSNPTNEIDLLDSVDTVWLSNTIPISYSSRVLIVVTNADLAGAPSHVRDLALFLDRQIEVGVAFGQEGPIKSLLESRGIPTFLIEGMSSQISMRADLGVIRQLTSIVRNFEPTLLHAHSAKAGMAARLVGWWTGTPVVYTVHGWGFGKGRPKRQSLVVWIIELLLMPFAARYITVSKEDARAARRMLGIGRSRMQVVHNGVHDSDLRADPQSNTGIVMVARVDRSKDHEMAVRAFDRVNTTMKLQLIGHGTDSFAFMAKARSWARSSYERIIFSGECTDVAGELARNAVFMLVSRYEGLPLSIIEAMRAGLPVIATDTGGVNELVESDRQGILVETGNVSELASALQRLIDKPGLRLQMGEAARERYRSHFRIEPMCEQVLSTYEDILNARHSQPASE